MVRARGIQGDYVTNVRYSKTPAYSSKKGKCTQSELRQLSYGCLHYDFLLQTSFSPFLSGEITNISFNIIMRLYPKRCVHVLWWHKLQTYEYFFLFLVFSCSVGWIKLHGFSFEKIICILTRTKIYNNIVGVM